MDDAEVKSARDILKDLTDLVKKMKVPNPGPFVLSVPDCYAEYAAKLYENQNVIVQSNNGSMYQYGVQTKWPGTHIDVSRLNARIAAMDLPDYLRKVYPKQNNLYRLALAARYMIYGGSRGCGKSLFPHNYDEEGENYG